MSLPAPCRPRPNRALVPILAAILGWALASPLSDARAEGEEAAAEASPASAQTQISPSYRAAIREYISLQGSTELTGQSVAYGMAEQTLMAIAQTGVEITEPIQRIVVEESLETFGKKFADVDYLTDLYAPIYAEHFSEQEIREIIAFYRSPVGKKTLERMIPITQAGNATLQEATFAILPGFQLAVDAKLREAGFAVTP